MTEFEAWSEAGVRDDIERAFSRGFKAGQQSCAATEWRTGPPPEQEGLEVLALTDDPEECIWGTTVLYDGIWCVEAIGITDHEVLYNHIVRHAVVNRPKEQP